jgi:hypothetical protein
MEELGGERRYSSYSVTTSALDGGEWLASRPGRAFTPGERTPGTHWTGGWVNKAKVGVRRTKTGVIFESPSVRPLSKNGMVVALLFLTGLYRMS